MSGWSELESIIGIWCVERYWHLLAKHATMYRTKPQPRLIWLPNASSAKMEKPWSLEDEQFSHLETDNGALSSSESSPPVTEHSREGCPLPRFQQLLSVSGKVETQSVCFVGKCAHYQLFLFCEGWCPPEWRPYRAVGQISRTTVQLQVGLSAEGAPSMYLSTSACLGVRLGGKGTHTLFSKQHSDRREHCCGNERGCPHLLGKLTKREKRQCNHCVPTHKISLVFFHSGTVNKVEFLAAYKCFYGAKW